MSEFVVSSGLVLILMAINPALAHDQATNSLFPLPAAAETYILRRENIAFKAQIPLPGAGSVVVMDSSGAQTGVIQRNSGGFFSNLFSGSGSRSTENEYTLKGKGEMFLTTQRIVFVASKGSTNRADFTSFEIPLRQIVVNQTCRPKFEQPVFGANYLDGHVLGSSAQTGIPPSDIAHWSLTFNSGGCGTFLPIFYRLLDDILSSGGAAGQQAAQIASAVVAGNFNNTAFIDPTDPSIIYVSQPGPNAQAQPQPAVVVVTDQQPLAQPATVTHVYHSQ